MPENITTVLNLPDADFGSGGFSNPEDNRAYILQGAGSRTPTDAILAACGYAGTPCVNYENSTEGASSIPHSTGHGVTRTTS